jgi:HEAT repeat protein
VNTSADPAARAMFEELEAAGIDTSDFGHFGSVPELGIAPSAFEYGRAVPILLRWLPKIDDKRVRESIVRSVTGEREARANGGAQAMIDEFRRSADDSDGLAWVAGNALSTLAGPSDADAIIDLLRDRRFGSGRQELCFALRRTKDPRTPQVLVELLDDDEVNGHAISALRGWRRPEAAAALAGARQMLEAIAARPDATVLARRQARQALAKIDAN